MSPFSTDYGLQRDDQSKLSPMLQMNERHRQQSGRHSAQVDALTEKVQNKSQVSLTPEEEGPNWLLWGGVAVGSVVGFFAIRHFFFKPK